MIMVDRIMVDRIMEDIIHTIKDIVIGLMASSLGNLVTIQIPQHLETI